MVEDIKHPNIATKGVARPAVRPEKGLLKVRMLCIANVHTGSIGYHLLSGTPSCLSAVPCLGAMPRCYATVRTVMPHFMPYCHSVYGCI